MFHLALYVYLFSTGRSSATNSDYEAKLSCMFVHPAAYHAVESIMESIGNLRSFRCFSYCAERSTVLIDVITFESSSSSRMFGLCTTNSRPGNMVQVLDSTGNMVSRRFTCTECLHQKVRKSGNLRRIESSVTYGSLCLPTLFRI